MVSRKILRRLKLMADPRAVAGMARYGINSTNTLGVSVRELRRLAREIGRNHHPALQLWASGVHEARILASLVDEPASVTEAQMERWVEGVDSWDVCDQCCGNLFVKQAVNWALRQIGKRSQGLRQEALKTARTIQCRDSRAARWIAADAIRELTRNRPGRKPLSSRP